MRGDAERRRSKDEAVIRDKATRKLFVTLDEVNAKIRPQFNDKNDLKDHWLVIIL